MTFFAMNRFRVAYWPDLDFEGGETVVQTGRPA
jgi:hypothetical protein